MVAEKGRGECWFVYRAVPSPSIWSNSEWVTALAPGTVEHITPTRAMGPFSRDIAEVVKFYSHQLKGMTLMETTRPGAPGFPKGKAMPAAPVRFPIR